MVVSGAVVDAEQIVPGWKQAVDLARPVVAELAPPVARKPEKGFLVVAEGVVDSPGLRVENVTARIVGYVIVPALGIARLVRQRIKLQIGLGNRAYPARQDDVIRERSTLDTAGGQLCRRRRIIDQYPLAQQRREVAISFGSGRDGELKRLGECISEAFKIEKDEGLVSAVVEPGYPQRAADRSAVAIVPKRAARLARSV